MNSQPLFASVLLSLWSAPAAELKQNDLCSVEATYLETEAEPGVADPIDTTIDNSSSPHFDYIDNDNHTLFSNGELDIERKITLDAAGTEVHSDTFNVGLHIAVNYTR